MYSLLYLFTLSIYETDALRTIKEFNSAQKAVIKEITEMHVAAHRAIKS